MITVNGIGTIKKMNFKTLPTGTSFVEMFVSFKTSHKKDGKYEYGYVKTFCFGKLAELYDKHFNVNDLLHIANGELRTDFYEKNGEKQSVQTIMLSHLGFVPDGKKKSNGGKYADDNVSF